MPFIIDHDKQKQAMKDIVSGLKELDSINRFLNAESVDNKYSISLTNAEGEKVTATGFCDDKSVVDQIISTHRESIRNKITDLAKQYHIDFDEKDYMILENEPAPEEVEPNLEDELVDPYVGDDETQNN